MSNDLLFINGIDGATGEYLLPPLSTQEITQIARGETWDESHLRDLKRRRSKAVESEYAIKEGHDPKQLEDSGWGVIFAYDADPAIREALGELLAHRRQQATRKQG